MTSERIKEAALQLFTRNGYDGAPLSEIAAAVGIKTPSIYAHFKSKDDLFLAVMKDCLTEHNRRMQELISQLDGLPVWEKLRTILEGGSDSYLLGHEQVTFLKRAMLFPPAALEEQLRAQFVGSEEVMHTALDKIFEEGMGSEQIRRESLDNLRASFYCVMDGLFLQNYYYRREDWKAKLDAVWLIFWKGICHPKHNQA
ncbi:TetR/AcrR family transcriptional regulator [Paenibacillus filicis]|uniref:TetR/AcrR family transcriptional regulator n=1 Tax=Paenibacillus filicis TaxID=669464 RepID=A0ABU9DWP0_9BACL